MTKSTYLLTEDLPDLPRPGMREKLGDELYEWLEEREYENQN